MQYFLWTTISAVCYRRHKFFSHRQTWGTDTILIFNHWRMTHRWNHQGFVFPPKCFYFNIQWFCSCSKTQCLGGHLITLVWWRKTTFSASFQASHIHLTELEGARLNHTKQFHPVSSPTELVVYTWLQLLPPATATAGASAGMKMINHPGLLLPDCSWEFAAAESLQENYVQCHNSASMLFRLTNLPCELKRNELSRPNSSFFSFPGCSPFFALCHWQFSVLRNRWASFMASTFEDH